MANVAKEWTGLEFHDGRRATAAATGRRRHRAVGIGRFLEQHPRQLDARRQTPPPPAAQRSITPIADKRNRAGTRVAGQLLRSVVRRAGRRRLSPVDPDGGRRQLPVERLGPRPVQRLGRCAGQRDDAHQLHRLAEIVLQDGPGGAAIAGTAGRRTAGAHSVRTSTSQPATPTRSAFSSGRTAPSSIRSCSARSRTCRRRRARGATTRRSCREPARLRRRHHRRRRRILATPSCCGCPRCRLHSCTAPGKVSPTRPPPEAAPCGTPTTTRRRSRRRSPAPVSYFETSFSAQPGVAYHVWVRMRAESDSLSNDSVHIQFDDALTMSGAAVAQIGSTGSLEFVIQDGPNGAPDHGWGWTENGWGRLARISSSPLPVPTRCACSSARTAPSSIKSSSAPTRS